MTLQVKLPEALAAQARELAGREHTTVDALIASALVATLNHSPHRPTSAERAACVDGTKVDAILSRVSELPPEADDER